MDRVPPGERQNIKGWLPKCDILKAETNSALWAGQDLRWKMCDKELAC